MAHFAELNEENEVLRVLVVDNLKIQDENGNEVEELGIDFLQNIYGSETIWLQTSYNTVANTHKLGGTPFRYNYATVGGTYDSENNAFIHIQPFNSWVLDENFDWQAPIVKPDPFEHRWDEELYQSDNTLGWVVAS